MDDLLAQLYVPDSHFLEADLLLQVFIALLASFHLNFRISKHCIFDRAHDFSFSSLDVLELLLNFLPIVDEKNWVNASFTNVEVELDQNTEPFLFILENLLKILLKGRKDQVANRLSHKLLVLNL